MARKRTHVPTKAVKDAGFRSKFEFILDSALKELGVDYQYEGPSNTIFYVEPAKVKRYVADFLLSNGVIIEAKGYFDADDRKKHLLIKAQHPELDIRILFMNSKTKINKKSPTTYAMWCEKNGFKYADLNVPKTWCNLTKNSDELRQIFGTLGLMSSSYAKDKFKETHPDGF